ncbi:GNAT family N-acetyltransferase [Pseudomonas guariconensis]|uniref:GNAT family N-acetyltransferase n=1 Tax=Pseudomonas guariconensis TaxID=1288410 RepID=UPI0018A90EF4|nr:GNAT family N-acetyltransferase [Pseudomonas guariconensis]MBF8722461.1 GNAT family N-acetyltransferase [Pseudomonas guariconensis]
MRIRPTRLHDVPLLAAIERSAAQAFLSLPDLAWLASGDVLDDAAHRAFIAGQGSWVAIDDNDHLRGFICTEQANDWLHIHEISVCAQAQGQGIGRALLQWAISVARSQGMRVVTLTTFAEVPWNAPFYARHGFKVVEQAQLDTRLREVLRQEHAHGLVGRCAMALLVQSAG